MIKKWKTIRVFISSTFLDMQAERDYIVRFVFPRLRKELLKMRIHLVDIDLRWGITSEQNVLASCNEIIDECRPRFLTILGERYGWIPEGKSISITEEEIRYAVLDHPEKHSMFPFFYFKEKQSIESLREHNADEFGEPTHGENEKKLIRLKQEIIDAGFLPFQYHAKWNSAHGQPTGLQELGQQIYEDILHSCKEDPELQERFLADIRQDSDEFLDERAFMEAFVAERKEWFVLGNRAKLAEELLAHLSATDEKSYIFLTGESGIGKSALLAHLSQQPLLRTCILIRHFIGASARSTDVRLSLRRFCWELKNACPEIKEEIPEEIGKLRDTFRDFLSVACINKRVIILLDGINQFEINSKYGQLSWLPAEPPANARFIISSVEDSVKEELSADHSKLHTVRLTALSEWDKSAIVQYFLNRYKKRLEPFQFDQLLIKADSNKPLYLLSALEELRTLGKYEEITQKILEIPDTTPELFDWILNRLENDGNFRDKEHQPNGQLFIPRFFSLLGASRNGLSQQELGDLLKDYNVTENLSALLMLLRPYLVFRGDLLGVYHRQFKAAIEHRYLTTEAQLKEMHLELAAYFEGQALSYRKASELLWQLQRSKESVRLKQHILNIPLFYLITDADQNELIGYWIGLEEEHMLGDLYLAAIQDWERQEPQDDYSLDRQIAVAARVGNFLSHCGFPGHAEQMLRKALALSEWKFPAQRNEVATQLNDLGVLLLHADRFSEAEDCYCRAFELYEEIYGQNHSATATCINNLGLVYQGLGLYQDAETCFRLSLNIHESIPGIDSSVIARDSVNLASLLKETFRFDEASHYLNKSTQLYQQQYGTLHPDTALSKSNFAMLLKEQGKIEAAITILREALQTNEQVFGAHHPRVAISLGNLADVLMDQRQLVEAEILIRQALKINESSFGKDHPQISLTLNNLGNCLSQQGLQEEAESVLRRSLRIQEKHVGLKNKDSNIIMNSLAGILYRQGRIEEAESLFRNTLKISESIFGDSHPRVAIRLLNLGTLLMEKGQLKEAESLLKRNLEILETIYGKEHLKVAEALQAWAKLLENSKQPPPISFYQRILHIYKQNFGETDQRLVPVIVKLAVAYNALDGGMKHAESLFRNAIDLIESEYGSADIQLCPILNHLGLLLGNTGRLEEAESLFYRALSIAEQTEEEQDEEIGASLNNLSLILHAQGKMAEAEQAAKRAMQNMEKLVGSSHPDYATALNNLSLIYFSTDRLKEAAPLCSRNIQILFGSTHTPGNWSEAMNAAINNYLVLLKRLGYTQQLAVHHISSLIESVQKTPFGIQEDLTGNQQMRAYLERGLWRELFKLVHLEKGKAYAYPSRILVASNLLFDSVAYPDSLYEVAQRLSSGKAEIDGRNRVPYEIPTKRLLAFCPLKMKDFITVTDAFEEYSILATYKEGNEYNPGRSFGGGRPIVVDKSGAFVAKQYIWDKNAGFVENYLRLFRENLPANPDFIDKSEGSMEQMINDEYLKELDYLDTCLRVAKRDGAIPIVKPLGEFLPVLRYFFPDGSNILNLFFQLVIRLGNFPISMEDLAKIRVTPELVEIRKKLAVSLTNGDAVTQNGKVYIDQIMGILEPYLNTKDNKLPATRCIVNFEPGHWPNDQVDKFPGPEQWSRNSRPENQFEENLLIFRATRPQGRAVIGYDRALFELY